jgi:pantothenate kinase
VTPAGWLDAGGAAAADDDAADVHAPGTGAAASETVALPRLADDIRRMHRPGERLIIGITGAPGSGKSTLGAQLVEALGPSAERLDPGTGSGSGTAEHAGPGAGPGAGSDAVLVGMDGFHLANRLLDEHGSRDRKGAPDTFDAAGYVALLQRLRARDEPMVYAPAFDRILDESIGSAIAIPQQTEIVITEGNYLLLDTPEWSPVAPLLDACWFVDPGEGIRMRRLVERHMRYGRSAREAQERARGSDERNARLIEPCRARASRVIRVAGVIDHVASETGAAASAAEPSPNRAASDSLEA